MNGTSVSRDAAPPRRVPQGAAFKAAILGAALLAPGCGGSSPTSDSSYPAVQGIYGSYNGIQVGFVRQTWTAADGTVTVLTCNAITSIPNQSGAQFSGSIDRLSPCNSQATLSGEIAKDRTLRFAVTQARWGSCTATGTNEYTGIVSLGTLLANGRISARCEDGSTVTIDEQVSGSLSTPPTTPG